MKDYLIKDRGHYIECELVGLKMTYTISYDPKHHSVVTLKDDKAYDDLKREINRIYDSYKDKIYGFDVVCDTLESADFFDKYFADDAIYGYNDIRDRKEIEAYAEEAFDKVWLIRNCYIPRRMLKNEIARPNMMRIFDTYNDIPEEGYDDWACGYWNGIMGALRWVLGDNKDFLDT